MEPLMTFDSGRATAVFTDLAFKLTSKTGPLDEIWPKLNRLKFRDPDGKYWAQGLCSKRWFRYDGPAWRPAGFPGDTLEGPAEFAALAPARPSGKDEDPFLPQIDEIQTRSGEANGVAVMEKITAGVRLDYQRGLYSSEDAERLLQNHYLADKTGRIWTIGFRSGTWHFYEDRKWMKSPSAPDPASLPGPDELKAINEDVRMALLLLFASDEPLPEKAALPWDPPADIPEKPRFCMWCFGVNPADSAFCRLCGAPGDKLVNDPEKLPRKIEAPETPSQPCPKCGRANDAEAGFCEQCGARLGKQPPAKNFCSSCGQKIEAGDLFCGGCGKKVL
jgi:hypothetical protein